MPFSFITATPVSLILPDGFEPALHASMTSLPQCRANPSANWLRHEFSTHTNRTLGFILFSIIFLYRYEHKKKGSARLVANQRFIENDVGQVRRFNERCGGSRWQSDRAFRAR